MDVVTLRTEIKAWEREWKAKHGRQPTVDEIKQLPAIAEKYKLYKKLSKSASSSQLPQQRSSTPPKSQPRPSTSAILHKSRAVKTEGIVTTSNPFSPVKKKPQHRDLSPAPSSFILPSLPLSARANPFTTPRKDKSKAGLKPHASASHVTRELSPDPFPLIQPLAALSRSMPPSADPSTSSHTHSQILTPLVDMTPPKPKANGNPPSTAVERARKRLRGEPVSPSPVKEKRARIASQTTLDFIKGGSKHASSRRPFDEDSDLSDDPPHEVADEDDIIIEATPMKPQRLGGGGKPFMALFQEAPLEQNIPIARSQSQPQSRILASSITTAHAKSQTVVNGNGHNPFLDSDKTFRSRAISPDSDSDDPLSAGGNPNPLRNRDRAGKIKAPNFSTNSRTTTHPTNPSKSKSKPTNRINGDGIIKGAAPSSSASAGVKPKAQKKGIPQALLPGKDDLWSIVGPSTSAAAAAAMKPPGDVPRRKSGVKRTSSDVEMEDGEGGDATGPAVGRKSPSTTQIDGSQAQAQAKGDARGKGKVKVPQSVAAISRKKAKLLKELGGSDADSDSDVDSNEEDPNVKVLDWTWRHKHLQDPASELPGADEDYDPTTRPPLSSIPPSSLPAPTEEVEGTCEISLPSDLERVLALSPAETSAYLRDKTERKVVKEILYGSRERHYAPERGGIVYDVGEGDDTSEGADGGEDDWEGEPVPWELGEL